MKRYKIEQSNADIISHGGLSLIGQAIETHTSLSAELDAVSPLRHGIGHSDIIKSYLGLLSTGKNDFEAINNVESEFYFSGSLDIKDIPSEATLRLRMDNHAGTFLPVIEKASQDFMESIKPTLTALDTGHVPLDADVTPMDNSGSKKEGVSRTYKGHDGYAPMAAYLGQEGYCVGFELRDGSQHCQKGTPKFLGMILQNARGLTEQPILVRLDSGNDAIENIDVIIENNLANGDSAPVDFLIKWNPRRQDKEKWLETAEENGCWENPRDGKRVAYFSLETTREWRGYEYTMRQVIRLTERTIDKHGQMLIEPEIGLEGWWTSLDDTDKAIIRLYADHGTSEQFHSEFKTDMDIERLPSGKFATNALVLGGSVLVYNILRWLGQNGLLGPDSPKRHKAKRRRIKTVMQELIYVAARIVKTARSVKISFGKGCRSFHVFKKLYNQLAYG